MTSSFFFIKMILIASLMHVTRSNLLFFSFSVLHQLRHTFLPIHSSRKYGYSILIIQSDQVFIYNGWWTSIGDNDVNSTFKMQSTRCIFHPMQLSKRSIQIRECTAMVRPQGPRAPNQEGENVFVQTFNYELNQYWILIYYQFKKKKRNSSQASGAAYRSLLIVSLCTCFYMTSFAYNLSVMFVISICVYLVIESSRYVCRELLHLLLTMGSWHGRIRS